MTGLGYEQLVGAATVGLAQRPLAVIELAGPAGVHSGVLAGDPAVAVLDAAALLDAARRAGGLVPAAVPLPDPAPEETAPELTPVAAELLRDVLAAADRELLADLLSAAARSGVRIPAPDLPAALTLAAQQRALRAPVAALLGARGRWLAGQHPDWCRVVDAAPVVPADDAWAAGRPAERVAWLIEQRRRDPAAARDALAGDWARETGEDRPALLAALAVGLGPADEPFLEAALDDRRAEVREQARALLDRLPGSAFVARAAARARAAVRTEHRVRLRVVPPGPPDAAARRDGLTAGSPHPAIGEAAWRLFQVVARAPLTPWPELLGDAPDRLVRREVRGEFRAELLAGWRAAAVREGDGEWARALLEAPVEGPLALPDDRLAALLPDRARVARAVAVLAGDRPGSLAEVAACPAPWPAALTDAVLGWLAAQARSAAPPAPGDLPRLAGRRIDVTDPRDLPGRLRELADRFRVRTASVPTAGRWAAPLERAAATLDLRRRFTRELP